MALQQLFPKLIHLSFWGETKLGVRAVLCWQSFLPIRKHWKMLEQVFQSSSSLEIPKARLDVA